MAVISDLRPEGEGASYAKVQRVCHLGRRTASTKSQRPV